MSHLIANPDRMSWWTGLVVAGACVSGVLVGYDAGIHDGMADMPTWMGDLGLDKVGPMGVRSVYFGGAVLAAIIASPAAQTSGRPYSTLLGTGMISLGTVFHFFHSPTFIAMYGRLVAGMGAGCITATAPLYLAEIVTPKYRSSTITGFFLAVCSGRMLGNGVSAATAHIPTRFSYVVPSAVTYCWFLLSALSVLLITSESPFYLVSINWIDGAEKALGRIHGLPHDHHTVIDYVRRIKMFYDSKIRGFGSPTFMKLIREENRRFLLIAIALQVFDYALGIGFLYKVGDDMLQKLGLQSSALRRLDFGVFEATGFLSSMLSVSFMGNRRSLVVGSYFTFTAMFIFLFEMSRFCAMDDTTGELTAVDFAAGVSLALLVGVAIMVHTTTWVARSWTVCAEIFPAMYRLLGLSIAVAAHFLAGLVSDIGMTYAMKIKTSMKMHLVTLFPCVWIVASVFSLLFVYIWLDDDDTNNCTMVRLDVNGVEMVPLPPRTEAERPAFERPFEDRRDSGEVRDSLDLDGEYVNVTCLGL